MTKSHYTKLSKRWRARRDNLQKKIISKHGESIHWLSNNYKQLLAGSLGGLMLVTGQTARPQDFLHKANASGAETQEVDKKVFLISDLSNILPHEVRNLNAYEEQDVSQILSRTFGITVSPQLEGKRLNRTYGYIGQEQHLSRYPGDTLASHFENDQNANSYWQQGMAPGLGAYRYFANSRSEMTQEDIEREKYYIAVQTFLSKDFNTRTAEYMNFYKYRKMLVVNPNNGKAIVADIADSGPAEWTGKQLGGSPEVMSYLERFDGSQKGPVLYFFIDDPDNNVKLGPIDPV